mmetsp:Transcript_28267/g.76570  ORF Transcript_28267/g.76570 Transcript_28267/m.76570 type:complete len:210 (-) Transcript_28267:419-1048(-)
MAYFGTLYIGALKTRWRYQRGVAGTASPGPASRGRVERSSLWATHLDLDGQRLPSSVHFLGKVPVPLPLRKARDALLRKVVPHGPARWLPADRHLEGQAHVRHVAAAGVLALELHEAHALRLPEAVAAPPLRHGLRAHHHLERHRPPPDVEVEARGDDHLVLGLQLLCIHCPSDAGPSVPCPHDEATLGQRPRPLFGDTSASGCSPCKS